MLLHFLERNKWEALFINIILIINFNNVSHLIKSDTVVILNGSELLVCYFHLATWKQVDMVFLQNLVPLVSWFSKESSLDLSAFFVHQVNVHKNTFTFLVSPFAFVTFLSDSCSDLPISTELVENSDRSVHLTDGTQPFLVQIVCWSSVESWLIHHRRRHHPLLFFMMLMDRLIDWWPYVHLVKVSIQWSWRNFIIIWISANPIRSSLISFLYRNL